MSAAQLSPSQAADRIVAGEQDVVDETTLIAWLEGDGSTWELFAAADRVRRHVFQDEIHLCSIVNAKRGGCPEDCGFCAQSKHFTTDVVPGKFLGTDELVEASRVAAAQHASALGLVTATRGLEDDSTALEKMIEGIRAVRDAGHTEAHASFGFVTEDALRRLKDAGLTELNHNLETGKDYFEKVVTTHTYEDRVETIRAAKRVGLRTCCGGIIGMGEEPRHRAQLALALRELDVDEVPLNFLVGIDGTRLAKSEPLAPMEMLRVVACFRLVLPRQNIFIAAGRSHLGQLLPMIFSAGASGMMVGDFLTTPNRSVQDDLDMVAQLGLSVRNCGATRPEMQPFPSAGHSAKQAREDGRTALRVLA